MTDMILIPKGYVIGWYGKDIPEGWLIADGKNGTPDFSNYELPIYDRLEAYNGVNIMGDFSSGEFHWIAKT